MNKLRTWIVFSGFFLFIVIPFDVPAQKYFETSVDYSRPHSGFTYSDTSISNIIYPYLTDFNTHVYNDDSFFNQPLIYFNKNQYALIVNPIIGGELFSSNQQNNLHSFLGLDAKGYFTSYLSAGINLYTHRGVIPDFAIEKTDSIDYLPQFGDFSTIQEGYHTNNFSWYVNFQPAGYLSISAGKGNQFIGSGYRSLFLSDNVEPYPYFRTLVMFDRIQYFFQVSFLENNPEFIPKNNFASQKYSSTHFLNFNVLPNLELGLFETVVWAPDDSTINRGLDINFLNPVIFFRPVEFSIGSPDNVLLGLSADLSLGNSINIYGQFLLDEFNMHYVTNTYKWWGNKYGYQVGSSFYKQMNTISYSVFLEYNQARPFTYSHHYSSKSYGHQLFPLAHPLGGNFRETTAGIRLKQNKLVIRNTLYLQQYASDSTGTNYGNDIFKPNATRSLENGSLLLQGIQKKVFSNRFLIGYTLHPVWKTSFTVEYILRKETGRGTGHYLFLGIRTGLTKHDIYDARY